MESPVRPDDAPTPTADAAALGHDQPAVPSEDVEECEEEEVPLRRKRSAYRRARTEFSTPVLVYYRGCTSQETLRRRTG
ncbi:hypothetical protein Tco_0082620, partial [Tanacetum coccineum]